MLPPLHAVAPSITRRSALWRAVVALLALVCAACAGTPGEPVAIPTLDATRLPPSPEATVASSPSPAPTDAGTPAPTAADLAVESVLLQMDLDTKLGQLLTVRVYGGELTEADQRNLRTHGVDTPAEVIETLKPGGVILFDREAKVSTGNLDDPAQVRRFTDDLRAHARQVSGTALLVAVDREGGRVDRLARIGTKLPSAAQVGQHPHAPLVAKTVAEVAATELKALGIDVNFAPVADLAGPDQPGAIGDRSYELDPRRAARLAAISIRAHLDNGVAPTVKHFPGHGATEVDSHYGLPTVDADAEVLDERELIPFRAALRAGVPIVMTGHLAVPALDPTGTPASVSQPVITGLLRETMGFDGVVVADALEMAGLREEGEDAALKAILAGTDVLLLPRDAAGTLGRLRAAVEDGRLPESRVDESVRRILRLKHSLGLLDDAEVARPDPQIVGSPELAERIDRSLRGELLGPQGQDPTTPEPQ